MNKDKKINKWKVAFFIVLILFIAETWMVGYLTNEAIKDSRAESECGEVICSIEFADSYYYEIVENLCSCYKNGEVVSQEIIG